VFKRILIANRGEIAVRLIRACHELGIEAVAVYAEVDAKALHVQMADRAILLGGAAPGESYLRGDRIIEAAQKNTCEAIHPGYGFLSESPDFAESVQQAGLVFIGPPSDAIRRMGIKTEARALMEAAGVPIVPGYQSANASDGDFQREADRIGYPVMVKAAGGGGGKGIRIVQSAGDLIDALAAARREAEHAFGDSTVFLEKYIERGRHIEIQVLADTHGNVIHLCERECSIQRRHQKIIEETPSLLLTPEIRNRMGAAAVEAARTVGYTNAGTVEFIADQQANFYFLEMNTRLQVEHPITEMVTGIDLAQAQIRIAAGEKLWLSQDQVSQRGHAIECRVYAEDSAAGFLPATGPILQSIPPQGPGIRVDTGVRSGDAVSLHYDPMISKLIVFAETREAALRRMRHALSQYVLLGVRTNLEFLSAVIEHPAFASGKISTHFISDHMAGWQPADDLPVAVLIAATLANMRNGVESEAADRSLESDGYSPWSRADSFRMGSSSL
jgi:acetyl-CoA carboxylase biotin carboxylase subunit